MGFGATERFLAGLAAFAALAAPVAATAEQTVVIVQKGRAFHPAEVAIQAGDRLTFTNNDAFIHQVYVSGLFDSDEKQPGENLTETFPNPGTFEVRCHVHPKMRLVVHVR